MKTNYTIYPNYNYDYQKQTDIFGDINNLDDYFEAIKKGRKELNKWEQEEYKKVVKSQVEAQKNAVMEAARKIQKEKASLEMAGIEMTVENENVLRKKALKEFNKQKEAEERKALLDFYKEKYKIETKYDKKARQESLKAREKENLDLIEALKAKEAEKGKLTKKEQEALKKAQAELKETALNDFAEGISKGVSNLLNNITGTIGTMMETYSKNQARINTRLMGARFGTGFGYYDKYGTLEADLARAVGVNPYFKTETMLDNLNTLVEAGIVSGLEQRAFLQTAKDEIATTFDAANSTLLRIIRLQQADSTAARLGMESYLTKFLNNLVENTEYMNQTFDNVATALLEASSVMGVAQATEFEYVVQKWLGSLTGTGLSENTATSIAQAIGYLGSGNISALSGTNMLNLVTMAASRAGLDIGTILNKGLTSSDTDLLMKSLVGYMVELGGSGSNVVKSELAQTFGLTFSDLVAARQLSPSTGNIYGNNLSFSAMYGELSRDLNTIALRTPMATMIDTLWNNLQFGLASNVAKNPALAALWKVTDMIQQNTGGINIPSFLAAGTGFDLNTTIENLMKLGIAGAGSLGMIGDLISGLGSTISPSSILGELNINPFATGVSRGTGFSTAVSGLSTSVSATIARANASGTDIQQATLTEAEDAARQRQGEMASEPYTTSEEGLQVDIPQIRDDIKELITIVQSIHDDTTSITTLMERVPYGGLGYIS